MTKAQQSCVEENAKVNLKKMRKWQKSVSKKCKN